MPGRHARRPGRRPALLLTAGIGLVVLLGGWLVLRGTGAEPTRATTVGNEAAPAPAAAADSAPAVLVSCARTLEAGAAVVSAADASRDHWGSHVRAQTDYDGGVISRQQMLDTFAATKAAGPADLAAYDAARAGYTPVSAGCTGLDPAAVPARWRAAATQCAARADAVGAAVQAGDAVVGDWRAHVQMMQNKPHTEPNAYGRMWRDMVNAAPPHLDGFAAARDALAQQPPCQPTPA